MQTTIFQEHSVCELSDGPSRVLIAPDHGARLLFWEIHGQRIIHWPDDADWGKMGSVRGGNPILFPFVARHMVDGQIGKWRDGAGVVRDLPMHGFARDMAFEVVEESEPNTLRMRLKSTPQTLDFYPFEFIFDVVYALREESLEVRFETTNVGPEALPYYAGHHFYFALPHEARPSWRLHLPCRRWGWQNPDGSVRFEAATRQAQTLDDAALIDRFHLDLAEQVRLEHEQTGSGIVLDLASPAPWFDVTTWTQSNDSDFFCIEPWLGLPNAIHHGQGLRFLAAGQSETALCRLSVATRGD